jgi:chromosome segregation ATPase
MLATRRLAFAERLPRIRQQQQASGLGLDQLQKRSDANAADLRQAEDAADGAAFADANERALQQRLARVTETLARLPADADPSLADARERLRRVAGALAWQLAHEYPARVWSAKKGQKQTEDALATARQRDADLDKAQRDEPARFEDFARRIAELDARIDVLMPRVAALSQEQQGALQEIAITELKAQKQRLAAYTAQARYAVAQLYDRATEPKEGAHADKP